jgi:hypothetical protein
MGREVISIGIGQGGVQLSNSCWEVNNFTEHREILN